MCFAQLLKAKPECDQECKISCVRVGWLVRAPSWEAVAILGLGYW